MLMALTLYKFILETNRPRRKEKGKTIQTKGKRLPCVSFHVNKQGNLFLNFWADVVQVFDAFLGTLWKVPTF